MARTNQEALVKQRHELGYYSVLELSLMFGISRVKIDEAINTGQIDYISPNAKTKFVKLNEFLEYSKNKKGESK